MATELHTVPLASLDAGALDALRRLALECALQPEPGAVVQTLRRGLSRLEGADGLEVCGCLELAEGSGALGELCRRAHREERVLSALDGSGGRGVAVPMRVRGEPAALALGWSAHDPGAERARALASALAEQAAVALAAAARLAEVRDAAFRRDRFFSAMSHDLRTPITAIVGYSELLQDGIVGELTERQQEMVERICQVSAELAQLVTDMLDLAKLDAGRMEFHRETSTLGAVLDAGLDGAEPHLLSSGSRVARQEVSGTEAVLQVDRPRVRQVLANLVAHAAQAVPGGEVRLSAGCDGGDAWVRVADDGPALPEGCEESLFEASAQGGSRTGRVGAGAVLSLALSRRIARAMGGEVEAHGVPGPGVTLTLRLPRGPAELP